MNLIFKLPILAFIISLSSENVSAQIKNSIVIGFKTCKIQNDFGLGVDFLSPYFANEKVAVRIGGNIMWIEHLKLDETTWTPYQNLQIAIRGRQCIIDGKIYIYGEGGSIILLPNHEFSSESLHSGGFGVFGFEFMASNHFGFYLEFGGAGTGAQADKIATKPIYSNGFISNAGLRLNL